MEQTWTITQLNQTVKKWLENEFPKISIEGEISNYKKYPSGHMYFSLKDEKSQASCVMFAGYNRYLKFTPKNGMHVKIRAKVSLYAERGQFQLIAESMQESGDGALQRAYELLKNKLQLEGLFDQKHKQPLPSMPNRIGVITSPKGAAIRDILTTLNRRFPSIPIIIYPALVQGNAAPAEIETAIKTANLRQECEVLIVGRGGGSLEDLQAFNHESVVRAIFNSNIPIISAVGHEVDFTISDFVADVRAPTPTAAAEIASPAQTTLLKNIQQLAYALHDAILEQITNYKNTLTWLKKALKDPKQKLFEHAQTLDALNYRLSLSIKTYQKDKKNKLLHLHQKLLHHTPAHKIKQLEQQVKSYDTQLKKAMYFNLENRKQQLIRQVQVLEALSPLQTLTRGYAIVKNDNHKIITKASQLKPNDNIAIQFIDGEATSKITQIILKDEIC